MVDVRRVDAGSDSEAELRALVTEHVKETGSERGSGVLADWETALGCFWEVVPNTKPLRERSQALVHVPQWSSRLTSKDTKDSTKGFIALTPDQLKRKSLVDAE